MTDVPVQAGVGKVPTGSLDLAGAFAMLRRGDILLAIGVLGIMVVLILPLPPVLLDLFLAVSIIFSVLILMTALFIQHPLEFTAFPTVLLIATMLRLSLNLASTRLILSNGHEGTERRRPRHRGLRRIRDGRQFRHRNHRLRHPGDREFHRHHQGLGPHRRGRSAVSRSMPCRASRWRSTPTSRPASSTSRRPRSAARTSRTKPPSTARWTAPRNS